MKSALIYSLEVWLTSLLLGPFVYYLLQIIMEPQYPHRYDYSLVKFSFVFSLPSFILSIIVVSLVRIIPTTLIIKKLLLCIVGVVFAIAPAYFMKGGWAQQVIEYAIAYGSIVIIGIWVYRLSTPNANDTV